MRVESSREIARVISRKIAENCTRISVYNKLCLRDRGRPPTRHPSAAQRRNPTTGSRPTATVRTCLDQCTRLPLPSTCKHRRSTSRCLLSAHRECQPNHTLTHAQQHTDTSTYTHTHTRHAALTRAAATSSSLLRIGGARIAQVRRRLCSFSAQRRLCDRARAVGEGAENDVPAE